MISVYDSISRTTNSSASEPLEAGESHLICATEHCPSSSWTGKPPGCPFNMDRLRIVRTADVDRIVPTGHGVLCPNTARASVMYVDANMGHGIRTSMFFSWFSIQPFTNAGALIRTGGAPRPCGRPGPLQMSPDDLEKVIQLKCTLAHDARSGCFGFDSVDWPE